VTRVQVLRAGYAALGLAFLALAWSPLLLAGLVIAFAGSILLLFSDDDMPKWSGLVLLLYYALLILSFLFSAPITFRGGGFYLDPLQPALASLVQYYLGLAFPLILAATALTAAWERERGARFLLLGAALGFVLVAILTIALRPTGEKAEQLAQSARQQGALVTILVALAALAGAAGAFWGAARPEEYA